MQEQGAQPPPTFLPASDPATPPRRHNQVDRVPRRVLTQPQKALEGRLWACQGWFTAGDSAVTGATEPVGSPVV